ncbi:protein translocase subunit SecF [Epidermidibacterium keratini]|uniref:Protein-export membrane protein SecF n=1 Tax=Epidermidibacterium keratini TaxID=1891644 RepID=A0A7L4YJN8_9ACTN|nr:protein translocase subunit SecF [Epidermidibacterium keratini]QHB99063.1 protein translocase subunit SecF [Epidermidibacterium keratini]
MPKKRMRSRDEEPEAIDDAALEHDADQDHETAEDREAGEVAETEPVADDATSEAEGTDDELADDELIDEPVEDEDRLDDDPVEDDETIEALDSDEDTDESQPVAAATAGDSKRRTRPDKEPTEPRRASWSNRLYTGESGFDFVGKRKITYVVSALMVAASIALIIFKGLNFGIDFAGGNTFEVPAASSDLGRAESVVRQGLSDANQQAQADNPEAEAAEIATSQVVGTGSETSILIKTSEVSPQAATDISNRLAEEFRPQIEERLTAAGTPITDQAVTAAVSNQAIDATWGSDVSEKALWALFWFLLAVSIFLRIRYRWGLVAGALVALLHDLIVTAGVYALIGFEVTPATVIGMLTILGFSLYDTVVVFDKTDENTRGLLGGSRMTYSEAANLAINQTLVRSINTSVISLLPVAALLFVGAGLLGAGTLKDLALVLFVGMAAGLYSSIFLAGPIACDITERQPEYIELTNRVRARRQGKKATGGKNKAKNKSAAKRTTAKRPGVKNAPARPAKAGPRAATERASGTSTAVAEREDADVLEGDAVPEAPPVRRNVGTTPKPGAKPTRKRKR